jgi:ribosomal protein S18 acetylase RimI-like enzyme
LRCDVAALFWQAFAGKLGPVMKPEKKALCFLERVIDPSHSICALSSAGELLGVAGFKTKDGAFVGGGLSDLIHAYGPFGGLWRGLLLDTLERDLKEGEFLMDGIFVSATARSQGIGTKLLEAVFAEGRRRGCSHVRLDVIDTNPRAKALYEKQGFRPGPVMKTGWFELIFGFKSATEMVRYLD